MNCDYYPPIHGEFARDHSLPIKLDKTERHIVYLKKKLEHCDGGKRKRSCRSVIQELLTCFSHRLLQLQTASKTHYVYHLRRKNFLGDRVIPLNTMQHLPAYSAIHHKAIQKYKGRESLLDQEIYPLHCKWNDVIFLSPLHPKHQHQAYREVGYQSIDLEYFQIPVEVLEGKRLAVYKFESYQKVPPPNRWNAAAFTSFCPATYREMTRLPSETREHYRKAFDPHHPDRYPKFHWYCIPHILCQDPIDLTDPRITLIGCGDSS